MFAKFYDGTKSKETNQEQFEKARHNKEVTQHVATTVAVIAGVLGIVTTAKKAYDAFK